MRLTYPGRIFQSIAFLGAILVFAPFAYAQSSGGSNVAVMQFEGPQMVDIDADKIWKMKNKTDPPTKEELTKLSNELQSSLIEQLRELLGKSVVPKDKLDKVLSSMKKESFQSMSNKVAKELKTKYLVTGTIDKVEFDGNTVLKDAYVLIVTTKVVDSDSGKRIWLLSKKKYTTKSFTRKTGGTVYDVFAKKQIPEVASKLASQIATKIGK